MKHWHHIQSLSLARKRGTAKGECTKRLSLSNLLVTFCAITFFRLPKTVIAQQVTKRLPKSDRTHKRLPKYYEKVTNKLSCFASGAPHNKHHDSDSLLRFPFSGPVSLGSSRLLLVFLRGLPLAYHRHHGPRRHWKDEAPRQDPQNQRPGGRGSAAGVHTRGLRYCYLCQAQS